MSAKLEFWVLPNDGLRTVSTLEAPLASFAREHGGARVEVKVRTLSSMWDRLFSLVKSGRAERRPDLVQMPAHWTSTFAHLGLLTDLGELDARLEPRSWVPAARESCRLAGTAQLFSAPWWLELSVLLYRRSALARLGARAEDCLADLPALKELCRALARSWRPGAGRFPIANPNPRETVAMTDVAPCVWGGGGDFFSADGSRCLFQRDDAFAGLEAYFDLLDGGWMPLIGLHGLPPGDLFDGSCALQLSGRLPAASPGGGPRGRGSPLGDPALPQGAARVENGRAPRRTAAPSDLGVAPFPSACKSAPAAILVQALAIPRETENPRLAYALLGELTREAPALAHARAIGAFPAWEGGLRRALEDRAELLPVFERALAGGRALPNLRVLGTLEKIFNRGLERAVREIMCGTYAARTLRREMIHAAAEIDYVLSLYN